MLSTILHPLLLFITTLVTSPVLAAPEPARERSEAWAEFVDAAARDFGEPGQRAAEFLARHRPVRDESIDPRVLEENLRYALLARERFPWARALSDERFFNDVLPYAVLDETRDSWRPAFFEKCSGMVEDCQTASEAAQTINRELFNTINVHYNTGRKAPNQSPSESVAQGRATCTGLSIILVDACRSVGIPARIAGVANWHDKRGNHTWVEIWDGAWHFAGADEPDPAGLDRGWFVGDASKAVEDDPRFAVWATSWARTGNAFPMVWAPEDKSVHAVNVTARYRADTQPKAPGVTAYIRLWDTREGERIAAQVAADSDGRPFATCSTRDESADLNDMPFLDLPPGEAVTLRIEHDGQTRAAAIDTANAGSVTLDLCWDELPLTREQAESLIEDQWSRLAANIAHDRQPELDARAFTAADHTLRYKERTFGDAPEGQRSLWISLHGGGGAPTEVNDQQWDNQIKLYEPEEGIYIAPRAPTDTWNLWHQGHIDPLFARLIETFVASRGVNPNRVYLMGYSAGGDGVYQLAPRMADRLAAAAMMAGHPNNARPEGLRNLPFAIFSGADDHAYNRAEVAKQWGEKLDALQADDPEGYPHMVRRYEGLGHWMQRKDAEALPWMAGFTRDPWPKRVVWAPANVFHPRQYWVQVDDPTHKSIVVAQVKGQTIAITADDLSSLTLLLHDRLIDLDRPITVVANGKPIFDGPVARTQAAIENALADRADPASCPVARLTVQW